MGAAQDRNAAAPRPAKHRFLACSTACASAATSRRCRFRFTTDAIEREQIDCYLAAHERPRARPRAREHRPVAAVQRPDSRESVRGTARRSKTRSCGFRIASGIRSSSSRKGLDVARDLRERLLDEPAARRAGGDRSRAAWPGRRRNAAAGVRRGVRLHPADGARRDAADPARRRAVPRRANQRDVRLRGGGGPGNHCRNQRCPTQVSAPGLRASAATRRTSACSWTT